MFARPKTSAPLPDEHTEDWRAVFERRYELGALLARGVTAVGGRLPAAVDAAAAGGHLLRACLAHRQLTTAPDQDAGATACQPACNILSLILIVLSFL